MKCRICDVNLTTIEIESLHPDRLIDTCLRHREVEMFYSVSISKKWFRFKENNPNADWGSQTDKFQFYRFMNHE